MVKYILIISLLVIAVCGCKKAEDRSCFKSTGDMIVRDTVLESYDTLILYDDIKYTLVPDTIFSVEIEGGENLVNHVSLEMQNNSLSVRNDNTCNFLRNLSQKIEVRIHVDDLNYIHFEGSEHLVSSDTLHSSELRLMIRDGVGDVDLTVENGYMSSIVSHGWGNFTLRGKTLFAYLSCSTNSYCDTRALKVSNEISVNSNTQGDMFVNADVEFFKGLIDQRGNIFYEGNPDDTSFEINGEGDIVHLNN